MIFWKEPLTCNMPFGCGAETYPNDMWYPDENSYPEERGEHHDRVIIYMVCPKCDRGRRWCCLVTETGDIFVPHRRVLLGERWPVELLP